MRGLRKWIAGLGALSLALALGAAGAWAFAGSWAPSRPEFRYQGLEIDAANGPVDWAVVRGGGADFVYLTATRGAEVREPGFEERWLAVDAAGLRRGAMHVYSLCRLATDQANNFNTTVPRAEDALPPVVALDFDQGCAARPDRSVVVDELIRYLTIIEMHSGKPALLKISQRFEEAYRLTAAIKRPMWAVRNYFPPAYGARPWRMWQASDWRRIDGVSTPIHWSVVAP